MVRIFVGNSIEVLSTLPSESVHCVVTSPPYWSLRDYNLPATVWGGDPDCDHVWGLELVQHQRGQAGDHSTLEGGPQADGNGRLRQARQGQFCQRCGAWCGCLGLEPTVEGYVAHLVDVFREVRRVLRGDGTCWVNLGDSYASSPRVDNFVDSKAPRRAPNGRCRTRSLKPKDLIGIPWRVAFALQADGAASPQTMAVVERIVAALLADYDTWESVPNRTRQEVEGLQREWDDAQRGGWWLRSAVVWHKPNKLPESVTDRPTLDYEFVFLLAKSERYFYDNEAIKEEKAPSTRCDARTRSDGKCRMRGYPGPGSPNAGSFNAGGPNGKRNKRSVWTIPTSRFKGAHFATFPPALVEPCVKSGTSVRGCCPKCGAPWERVVKKSRTFESGSGKSGNAPVGKNGPGLQGGGETLDVRRGPVVHSTTTGWRPTCSHYPRTDEWRECPRQRKDESDADYAKRIAPVAELRGELLALWESLETISCIVLDPFAGAGTTLLVSERLGRDSIGIELNPEYAEMARRRIYTDAPLFTTIEMIPSS